MEKPLNIKKAQLKKKFKQKSKLTEFEIFELCESLGLELNYHEWVVQFVSEGHEVDQSGRLLYQFKEIQM